MREEDGGRSGSRGKKTTRERENEKEKEKERRGVREQSGKSFFLFNAGS